MPHLRDIQIRDPFILRQGEQSYLYGSTDPDIWKADGIGFDVYRATDDTLTEYEGPFAAFRPPEGFWARRNFWAPEVYAYKGAWYMFATFLPENGRRGTAVLRAESPLGPFEDWSGRPVTPAEWECLDGTLYIDDGGKPWMVFCHEWQQVGDGEICAMPLQEDLRAAAGEPQLLFRASEAAWAKPLQGRAPGSYVTDGPFLHRAGNGALLLLWSSFGEAHNYCIGVASSQSGTLAGPWRQSEAPLYEADGGHGMLFRAPDGELYLAVHTPNQTPNERAIFLQLHEEDGTLRLAGPVVR